MELLEKLIEELKSATVNDVELMRDEALRIIGSICGKNSTEYRQVKSIGNFSITSYKQEDITKLQNILEFVKNKYK